jgi:hypoxanthine phosphoribosyltransferase
MAKIRPEQLAVKMTWKEFDKAINILVEKIRKYEKETQSFKFIYGVPRGGLVVAVTLSHKLNKPIIMTEPTPNENVLVVDDIADSGNTLQQYKDFHIATIFWKAKSTVSPDFYYRKIEETIWCEFPWE